MPSTTITVSAIVSLLSVLICVSFVSSIFCLYASSIFYLLASSTFFPFVFTLVPNVFAIDSPVTITS